MFRARDREKCEALFQKYYRGRKFHDSLYLDLIHKHARPGQRVLDAGCGRYLTFCREFPEAGTVVGIDLDDALQTRNAKSPFGVRGDIGRLPFPSGHFDLVICRSVVEHLVSPQDVFREFNRVLRPGGKVVLITPNKYDYISLLAALTPYSFHRFIVSRIFQAPEDDVFPTLYRANTMARLRTELEAAGFRQLEMRAINHYPAYLTFSPVLFRLGVLYERVTSLEALKALRGSLLCAFENSSQGSGIEEHVASTAGVV
jgi:ubiquinone/menaquinone biosynthesis C-methylase UbiE